MRVLCYKLSMNNYLLLIKDDPNVPDEDVLHALELYGFDERKAKITLLLLRQFGKAPAGRGDYETSLERQEYLEAAGLTTELIYREPKIGGFVD